MIDGRAGVEAELKDVGDSETEALTLARGCYVLLGRIGQ
jgi:hypothetical protein